VLQESIKILELSYSSVRLTNSVNKPQPTPKRNTPAPLFDCPLSYLRLQVAADGEVRRGQFYS
jgi:hypothetical protein